MRVAALAGGVGGAKLAHGLASVLAPDELTLIVNTGDDFDYLGLRICPDLDTVCYTLAGLANIDTGWGQAAETWQVFSGIQRLGGPSWFRLGDRDLATHLERTRLLREGEPLSAIVRNFCEAWGVRQAVLPMTDDRVATILRTDEGDLEFQEYFVHRDCRPKVHGVTFSGAASAGPAPGVIESLRSADGIILCPSNPFVSIAPIMALPGVADAIDSSRTVAVSPIVGGEALKGPAAKMFREMGIAPSATAISDFYGKSIAGLVLDEKDARQVPEINARGTRTLVTRTVMKDDRDRRTLAQAVLEFLKSGWQ
jgi:LPPG:FO 2-phospho-L-lactate transferase